MAAMGKHSVSMRSGVRGKLKQRIVDNKCDDRHFWTRSDASENNELIVLVFLFNSMSGNGPAKVNWYQES